MGNDGIHWVSDGDISGYTTSDGNLFRHLFEALEHERTLKNLQQMKYMANYKYSWGDSGWATSLDEHKNLFTGPDWAEMGGQG